MTVKMLKKVKDFEVILGLLKRSSVERQNG